MTRRRYFIVGVIILVILGALDLFFTRILTPDLRNEGNTLVTEYGFGWGGIILFSIGLIIFVTIPFYYHCLVYNYPDSIDKNSFRYITRVLFRNHKNPFLSLGKFLFYTLGFYLFWKYFILKITAIIHNVLILFAIRFFGFPGYPDVDKSMVDHYSETWFYNIVKYYWEIPSRRFYLMDQVENIFLLIIILLFIGSIIYKAKKNIKRKHNTNSIHFLWIIGFFMLYASFKVYTAFPPNSERNYSVNIINTIDPDIVLINFGEGDRAFIGKLLMTIDSCKPILIGIDAFFIDAKDYTQDSILLHAFKTVKNDILIYDIDSQGRLSKSLDRFRSFVNDEGQVMTEEEDGLLSSITPIAVIDNKVHEHFALKIIKIWKPQFKPDLKINQSIPIKFTRTLEQFIHFDSTKLKTSNICEYLTNRVVLLGYLGPSNEDKHFTPIRLVRKYNDSLPDTYGLVIVANEIRTILEYEK
jgi:CHASE2 domain-containing protein